tara:strand:+ start:247 stop:3111 length:2865 start_codon:yes stop_codon:yes gene_type:complete
MANRIPLVVDTTDGNKIKELPVGDNLDLTNSSLLNATSVQTQTLSIGGTAFTGSYTELTNRPTIPADISDLTDTQSLLGQGGGGGNTIIQGGGGLIITADDSVQRTILPGNTLQIQGSGDVSTSFTNVGGTDTLTISVSQNQDNNTTYTYTAVDGNDANSKRLRLTDSTSATQDVTLVAGTNVGITRSGSELTLTSTDTDTSYGLSSATDGDGDVVMRLTSSGGATDDVKVTPGTNISVTRTNDTSFVINNTQTLANAFGRFIVGSSNVDATSTGDALTLNAGSGISLTPNVANRTVQIDNTFVDQSLFQSVSADTGSRTAQNTTDSLSIIGGTGISTSITNNVLTVEYVGASGGASNNFETIAIGTQEANVQMIADDPNDTLFIAGAGHISIAGTGSGAGTTVDQITIGSSITALFTSVDGDTGTKTATGLTENLKIKGGSEISTAVNGSGELVIDYTGAGLATADNHAYKTITITTGGGVQASSNVDTLNIAPGTGISITGNAATDTISFENTSPNVDQNIFLNVLAGGQTITADTPTDTLAFVAGTGISVLGNATSDEITITNSAPNVDQNIFAGIQYGGNLITPATASTNLTLLSGGGIDFSLNNSTKELTFTNTTPNVDQNIFANVAVSGQPTVTTASTNEVLTFVAGTNVSITTDNTAKSVTINSTASGGNQNLFSEVAVTGGGSNIVADSNTDTLTFTAGTGISINANPTTDTISITNTSPNVNQNVFETFNADSGSYVAAAATDEFNIVGGTDISTSITGSTLTINYTGGGGGGGSQNLFATVAGDSGSTTANTQTDTLTVAGGNDIATSITGDTVTISASRTRTTANVTTGSIANNSSTDATITGFKTYALYKIQTTAASWVRLYTDTASRTADASRTQGVDPAPDAGVVAEIITTGADTVLMSPFVGGFNNESSPTTDIPIRVTNLSGGSTTFTITLTLLRLED